jgi:hypothetical protein
MRQKVISEAGSQQLLLDTYNLKTLLLHMHSLGEGAAGTGGKSTPAPVVYSKFVLARASQIETVLKLVGTPPEVLVERFRIMWPEGRLEDLGAVMTLKGMRRQDQQALMDAQAALLAPLAQMTASAPNPLGSAATPSAHSASFSASSSSSSYYLDPVAGGAAVAGSAVASASLAVASSVRNLTVDLSTSALTGLSAVGNLKWGTK